MSGCCHPRRPDEVDGDEEDAVAGCPPIMAAGIELGFHSRCWVPTLGEEFVLAGCFWGEPGMSK
jgi:hypothetical protein